MDIEKNFHDEAGNPAGGISHGPGYTIAWQNGSCPLGEDGKPTGRNGAFLTEVLKSCYTRLIYYQSGGWSCKENAAALACLGDALKFLNARRERRRQAGTLGTHASD